ncbi:MAG: insulinase family protein [Ignavibacteriae bacterium]|nr:insulinase family protein [Ignavibacteriota bacterium]NOG97556.1 insulinase family protein [Ignavibacteriota bacterium]
MNRFNITKLDNGIKVITEHIPYVESFSLGFWLNVGSRDELKKNNGISHFIEHMLFKGTKKRNAKKIADDIESLGGYLNAFTSKEHTCFYGRGLNKHLKKTFEVLADMLQNPLLKSRDIKKEASVIIDELNDIKDSPEELIFDEFENNIYHKNSLGRPIIGNEKNISSFTAEDLVKFIDEQYGFNKLFIVASGNINHLDIIKLTEKYITKNFGHKKNNRRPIKFNGHENKFLQKEIQQSHVILGLPTYGVKDKERIPMSLISHILGEGSSSRLFQSLRERNGIAYQINTFLNSFFDVSSFGIYYSTNDRNVNKAQHLIGKEFAKLKTKRISDKELKRAKEYLKGNIILSLESTTNRMLRIAQSMIYLNRIKSLEETIFEIDSVTPDNILDYANRSLNFEKFNKVEISSKNGILN